MAIAKSRVTVQGQISVPADVRKLLGIGPGSILEWERAGEGVLLKRAGRFTSEEIHQKVFGGKVPKKRTEEELKEGIRTYLRKRYARD